MFKKTERQSKIKMFVYSASGIGKTTLALQFPKPCIIDFEEGSNNYHDSYDFACLYPKDLDEFEKAIVFLQKKKHDFETLVIDPITILWDMFQSKWHDRFLDWNRRTSKPSVGYKVSYYEFQPGDWKLIKADWRKLLRMILALPMNIVATAREKPLYADTSFMRKIGDTFDGEKNLPYEFDIVLRLVVEKDKHIAINEKHRSATKEGLLPDRFELNPEVFDKIFSKITDIQKLHPPNQDAQAFLEDRTWLQENFPYSVNHINEDNLQQKCMITWEKLLELNEVKSSKGKRMPVDVYLSAFAKYEKEDGLHLKCRAALEILKARLEQKEQKLREESQRLYAAMHEGVPF